MFPTKSLKDQLLHIADLVNRIPKFTMTLYPAGGGAFVTVHRKVDGECILLRIPPMADLQVIHEACEHMADERSGHQGRLGLWDIYYSDAFVDTLIHLFSMRKNW